MPLSPSFVRLVRVMRRKLACAERIVNPRISEVLFGIEDNNPKVDH